MDAETTNKSYRYHKLEGNEAFLAALERYVEENKPDPLVKKQIEGWEMSWKDQESSENKDLLSTSDEWAFSPTDVIQGTLTWKGDYLIAELHTLCCWEPTAKEENSTSNKQVKIPAKGSFYFSVHANLQFRTKFDKSQHDQPKSKEEKKSEEKIRAKMIQRLREDRFIKQLLVDDKSKKSEEGCLLCEATIKAYTPEGKSEAQFEERVDVIDNVAESLRRAVFSRAESTLDIAEVLLNLPLLPGSVHDVVSCPMADRAKLRLLEDAMFDECEKQDDEIIDELKISTEKVDSVQKGNQNEVSNKRTKRAR